MRISDWSSDVCSSDLRCFEIASFDTARQIQIVERTQQFLRIRDDVLRNLAIPHPYRPEKLMIYDFREAKYGIERRAQFMDQLAQGFTRPVGHVQAIAQSGCPGHFVQLRPPRVSVGRSSCR